MQFIRNGYFCLDALDAMERAVFKRTIDLRNLGQDGSRGQELTAAPASDRITFFFHTCRADRGYTNRLDAVRAAGWTLSARGGAEVDYALARALEKMCLRRRCSRRGSKSAA